MLKGTNYKNKFDKFFDSFDNWQEALDFAQFIVDETVIWHARNVTKRSILVKDIIVRKQ